MDRNHLRAALIALCVLAVIFGASLFPATGFGSYPAGPGGGDRAGLGGANHGGHSTVNPGTTTNQQSNTGTTAAQTTSSDSNGQSTTTTTTTTNVGAGASNHPSAGGGNLLGAVVEGIGVALLCLVGLLFAGFRRGTVRVGGGSAIPLVIRGIPIGELVGKIPARTIGLVVGFSASIPRFTDDALGLLAELGRGLSAGTVGLGSAIAETVAILGRGFGGAFLAIGSVGSGLFSMPKTLSRPTFGRSSRKSEKRTTTKRESPAPEPEERGPPSIEEAWESMTDHLPVRRRRTTTPAEYARVAMDRGYPTDAVRQLTDAFREVRYGSFPASGKRTKLARAAIDKIERFRGDDE